MGDWETRELDPDEVEEVRHGHRVPADPDTKLDSWVRGISTQGELVALLICMEGEEEGSREWQPKKVFFQSG